MSVSTHLSSFPTPFLNLSIEAVILLLVIHTTLCTDAFAAVAFGGVAGLFLGCSLLSGVEMIYYLTVGLFYQAKRAAKSAKLNSRTTPEDVPAAAGAGKQEDHWSRRRRRGPVEFIRERGFGVNFTGSDKMNKGRQLFAVNPSGGFKEQTNIGSHTDKDSSQKRARFWAFADNNRERLSKIPRISELPRKDIGNQYNVDEKEWGYHRWFVKDRF